jgi:hypothetical protein
METWVKEPDYPQLQTGNRCAVQQESNDRRVEMSTARITQASVVPPAVRRSLVSRHVVLHVAVVVLALASTVAVVALTSALVTRFG